MLFLALRHLLSRKRQTFLTLLGILLGTAAYCVISGMMMGFQVFIINQLVNNDSHVRVTAREEILTEEGMKPLFYDDSVLVKWIVAPSGRRDNAFIQNPLGWIDRLSQDPQVLAFSPQLNIQAITTRAKISVSTRLIGADPAKQSRVTNIEDYMLSGTYKGIGTSGNRVIVGEGLLKKLGAKETENVMISSGAGVSLPFKIVGVFRLGIKTLDDTTIFGSLTDIQKLNYTPSRISDIAIRLVDVEQAASKASTWNALTGDKVQSWDQSNEGIMSVFKTQDIVRNTMTVSIIVVAAFGIYNILSMAVNHKRREIAILRSMGYVPRDIMNLFLAQGVILGGLGGLIGCVLGFVGSYILSTVEVSPDRGLGGNTMLVSFAIGIYLKGFGLAFLSSSLASLLPARAAGKMQPIEIIRNEAG